MQKTPMTLCHLIPMWHKWIANFSHTYDITKTWMTFIYQLSEDVYVAQIGPPKQKNYRS